MSPRLLPLVLAALLAACGALPDKPVRETQYDFGPVPAAGAAGVPSGAPLVLPDVEVGAALETTALFYRLGYAVPFQLRPYAYARWSAPPGQLVRQRLREHIGRSRPVIESAGALARRGGVVPATLRVELEEFSQLFDSQSESQGVLRLRCTLIDNTPAGESVVAQRSFHVRRPAPSADAAGGVRALTAATDAAAQEIGAWLREAR
jgi:cholesterol transport system auxiliary component